VADRPAAWLPDALVAATLTTVLAKTDFKQDLDAYRATSERAARGRPGVRAAGHAQGVIRHPGPNW